MVFDFGKLIWSRVLKKWWLGIWEQSNSTSQNWERAEKERNEREIARERVLRLLFLLKRCVFRSFHLFLLDSAFADPIRSTKSLRLFFSPHRLPPPAHSSQLHARRKIVWTFDLSTFSRSHIFHFSLSVNTFYSEDGDFPNIFTHWFLTMQR